MSEPKLISPMLDNFIMGDPISSHGGVRCCPAMEKDSNSKFIVKIISVPASASQIDALLLTGAYSYKAQALAYFKDVADDIAAEAEALKALSKLEGFVSFDQWQVVPMDDESGYDVYLLGTYKKSLEKILRTDAITHLSALNLGLDLCSALSVCRRSGYLYVDLKPDNIYLTGEQGYRIGDLGLIKLDSLKYASLPERYRSQYTAPEIADAFSSLNTTIDVYAVGLILYQTFNGGVLPKVDTLSLDAPLPAPDYADYEMAEIILKACAPDPADRWSDPVEMGQALVSYMQRNGAHDTPIVPVPVIEPTIQEDDVSITDVAANAERVDEAIEPAVTADNTADTVTEEANDQPASDDSSEADTVYAEDSEGNLSFLTDDSEDETLPGQADEELDYEQVSEEVTDMLNQADELIAHPTPDPVVAPDPIDVPIPPPLPIEPAPEEVPAQTDAEDAENATTDAEVSEEAPQADECPNQEATQDSTDTESAEDTLKPRSHWLRNCLLILLGLALLAGGFLFYKFYYLQDVTSMALQGSKNQLTVYVTTDVDDSDLSVVCSDTYGNKLTQPVVNGAAVFENLAPGTPYKVTVDIKGFHKLTGEVSKAYTTPAMTTISQFTAVTGPEDGSAILTFTADGPVTKDWKVTYSCEGEAEKEVTFSGVMTTVTGLTVGNSYTFTLAPVEDIYTTGTMEITHTASKLVLAQDLAVTSCYDGILTAQWNEPEGVSVASWTVRCYNDSGYNVTIVTEDLSVTFENITDTNNYTVEVLAAGMSVNQHIDVSKNSITITDFSITDEGSGALKLSWNSNNAPEGEEWILLYNVDGSPSQKVSVVDGYLCEIPRIPGAKYVITLQAASGSSVLGGQLTYTTKAAESFDSYGVDAEHMEFKMCVTPKDKNWNRYDVDEYTTTFSVGEKASFVVRLRQSYKVSSSTIEVLYVIRNKDGNIVSFASKSQSWTSMWYKSYGEFNVPSIPDTAGDYSITVYFNGAYAGQENFTVVN